MLSRSDIACVGVVLAIMAAVQTARADVVAVVNGEPISRAEFGLCLVRSLGRGAMETFVDWTLMAQEARRQGITVTEADLAERRRLEVVLRLRSVAENARMSPEQFRLAAQVRGWDMAELQEQLEESISDNALRVRAMAEKMLTPRLDLSQDALRAYYERTRGRRYAAAHVVVRRREEAERLLEALRGTPELWPQAVLQSSLDRLSVPYQGRIRPVPAGSELGKVLAAMQPGELKLYQEGDSWHVLRFVGTIPPSDEGFDDIGDQLRAELIALTVGDEFHSLLASLNRDACIIVNLSSDPRVRRLLGEETAVFVNGEPLPVSGLADVLVEEFGSTMLEPYVERTLIMQEARTRGLSVSQEEFEARMQAIAQQLFEEQAAQRDVTAGELAEALSTGGTDVERVKEDLVRHFVSPEDVRATLLAEKMVADGVEVSEADVAEAYGALAGPRCVVKELTADTADAAEQMYRKIGEGASFDLIARTQTRQPGVWLAGSLLRTVTSSHPYHPYVKDLKAGEISGVFKHGGKYRIIKLLERHSPSEPPPLDSVRESLTQEVRLRKAMGRIRALLVKLKAESDIEITLQ